MKIVITGSSGFIGKWVSESALDEGHEIVGLDREQCPYEHLRPFHKKIDILDYEGLRSCIKAFAPHAIIHLAARCDLDGKKLSDYATNIEGVRNICRIVAETPSLVRVIYTSSQLVCRVGYTPLTHADYKADTVYGQSKVQSEKIVHEEDGGGATWCLVRPTTVWGPYMSQHYRNLLKIIESGRYFHSGDGALFKSYAYAGNIAYQYLQLLRAPEHMIHQKTFYLADYKPLSLREYANSLARSLGAPKIRTLPLRMAYIIAKIGDLLNLTVWKGFPYTSFRLRNIRTEYIFDLSETHEVCGDLPYTFEEGVRQTVRWYLDNRQNAIPTQKH